MERVDDRKVLSGIIHVIQKGLNWVRMPQVLYNQRHWSQSPSHGVQPQQGGGPPDQRAKGDMTSKLPMACDSKGGSGSTCVRGNAVTSLVLMGCQKTCRLLLW